MHPVTALLTFTSIVVAICFGIVAVLMRMSERFLPAAETSGVFMYTGFFQLIATGAYLAIELIAPGIKVVPGIGFGQIMVVVVVFTLVLLSGGWLILYGTMLDYKYALRHGALGRQP